MSFREGTGVAPCVLRIEGVVCSAQAKRTDVVGIGAEVCVHYFTCVSNTGPVDAIDHMCCNALVANSGGGEAAGSGQYAV